MHVAKPAFRYELNLNTAIVIAGFLFTWGVTYATLESGRTTNAANIERLDARVATIERSTRQLDNHEIRLTTVEAQARDAAVAMRTVEASLNALASDIRLTREIVQRLETAQTGNRSPRQ